MITDKELAEQLCNGELAYVSAEFWKQHKHIIPTAPDHPIWEKLKTFQAGWVACKQFYSINN